MIKQVISLAPIKEHSTSPNIKGSKFESSEKIMKEDVGGGNPPSPVGPDGSTYCYNESVPTYRMACAGVEGYMNCQWVLQGYNVMTYCFDNVGGASDGGYGGGSIPGSSEDEESSSQAYNKLCASSFIFTQVVAPGDGSRGWKEAALKDLVINVTSSNYFENIWNILTAGTASTIGTFNLTVGVPGDLPSEMYLKR